MNFCFVFVCDFIKDKRKIGNAQLDIQGVDF